MSKTEEQVEELLKELLEENPAVKALDDSNEEIKTINKGIAKDGVEEEIEAISSQQYYSFRRYKDRSYIGRKILKDLIDKRNDGEYEKVDKRTGEKRIFHGYYLKESNKKVGLLSQLYGASGLFTLITRFNALTNAKGAAVDEATIRAIKSAVFDVLEYVDENGYDLNPFIDDKTNNELFHTTHNGETLQYIGAMTWALSLFVQARKAIRNNSIDFSLKSETDELKSKEQLSNTNIRIMDEIKKIINFFLDNAIDDKKNKLFGWGYANGCTEPSLFFTYSVIEAYSDFEDNVLMGSKDEELLDYINQGITKQEDRLENRFKAMCEDFGDRTWEIYKDTLKNNFFSDRFDGKANVVTRDEILRSGRSSALFNNIYILFILFYSSTNIRHVEERDKIVNAMMRSLQLVQNFYNDLKEDGNEGIVDMHIISFNQKNSVIPEFNRYLKDTSIQASSLLPMLVKANNLIAYWILKFPQKSMSEMFDEILKNKLDGKWLWEDPKYDLLSTERYIEAIADFYDYYEEYEAKYVLSAQLKQAQEILTERDVKKEINKKVNKGIEKCRAKAEEEARKTVADEIRCEFEIENAINKRIDDKVEQKVNGLLKNFFAETFSALIDYNSQLKEDKHKIKLTSEQEAFKKLLEDLFVSYVLNPDDVHDAAMELNKSENVVKEEAQKDIAEFRKEYMQFIAKHCGQRATKRKLADIFKLIEE